MAWHGIIVWHIHMYEYDAVLNAEMEEYCSLPLHLNVLRKAHHRSPATTSYDNSNDDDDDEY